MRLRYSGVCRVCGTALQATTVAIYERSTKTIRCVDHEAGPAPVLLVDSGTPGASARREFERRRLNREQRVRTKHPKIGGFILAVTEEPQTTRSWDIGARGEERVGGRLNEMASDRLKVLHDRRIPGSRANIDHLAVCPSGVWVIDPKAYDGRPHLKIEGGLFRPRTERLFVGSRDRSNLVDGVLRQIEVVWTVVGSDVPVLGALCFIDADWPLIGATFTTRGVRVLKPKKLFGLLAQDGPIGPTTVADLHRRLATSLPPA
jgi:hypothetical protein